MIYDTLSHAELYYSIHPRLKRALELMKHTDFSLQSDGTYEVEGRDLYYFLQSYEPRPANLKPEAHKLYADMMMMLSGRERIDVAPLERLEDTGEDTQGDIRFYRGETLPLLLDGDRFVVFFPGDAHAPGIAAEPDPKPCRKLVFKIRL